MTRADWGPPGTRAGDAAARLLGKLDRSGEGLRRARVVATWREVAGPEVASHARGFALRGTELLVYVDSNVWANELAILSEEYRTALNERLGKEAVGSIRFAVSKKVADRRAEEEADAAADRSREHRTRPVPVTETEAAQIRHMAAAVKNQEVREAVVAAAIRNLEWRKGIEAEKSAERAAQRAGEPKTNPEPKDSW